MSSFEKAERLIYEFKGERYLFSESSVKRISLGPEISYCGPKASVTFQLVYANKLCPQFFFIFDQVISLFHFT